MPASVKLERLKKAVEMGRQDWETVLACMRSGEMQFHEAGHACAITQIGISGRFRTLYVHVIAGDILDVPQLTETVEAFGRQMKCQVIETTGRLGWERYFRQTSKAQGYRKVAVKYRKDL
jgi:ribosomal protein L37E